VKAQVEAAAGSENLTAAQERREGIEAEMAAIMKRYHGGSAKAPSWRTKSTIHVNGGISLRPGEFTIRTSASSPALRQFKQLAKGAGAEGKAGRGAGKLIRSRPTAARPVAAAAKPAPPTSGAGRGAAKGKTEPRAAVTPNGTAGAAAQTAKEPPPKAAPPKPGPQPPAALESLSAPTTVAKNVSLPAGAAGAGRVVGELSADGRIVFRKAAP
jgi:hypothetical protein